MNQEISDEYKKKYLWSFLGKIFMTGFGVTVTIGWLGMLIFGESAYFPQFLLVYGLLIIGIAGYWAGTEFLEDYKVGEISKYSQLASENEQRANQAEFEYKKKEESEEVWKNSLLERSKGFPTLNHMISLYEETRDEYLSDFLTLKKNPALKASEVVKEETRKRREFEGLYRQAKSMNEFYEKVAPFLSEYKDDFIEEEEEFVSEEYTLKEREDAVTRYLPPEEYRKLPEGVRNQKALERYWSRNHRNVEIGKMYERYVGYLYEKDGYNVEYVGIEKEKGDLGRDLVCTKGNEHIVIQCKFWSQFKTIHEKHIFYLFGTVFQYRLQHKGQKIRALFYTTTKISDLAKAFAKELDIEIREAFPMDKSYPCIKCNIGVKGDRIYHLPFDQQYDNTHIETKTGEFYCSNVAEAEKAGFRHAYRWKGTAKV